MRVEWEEYQKLKAKYEKAVTFITKLLPYQDHEYPMSSIGFDAENLLKELENSDPSIDKIAG